MCGRTPYPPWLLNHPCLECTTKRKGFEHTAEKNTVFCGVLEASSVVGVDVCFPKPFCVASLGYPCNFVFPRVNMNGQLNDPCIFVLPKGIITGQAQLFLSICASKRHYEWPGSVIPVNLCFQEPFWLVRLTYDSVSDGKSIRILSSSRLSFSLVFWFSF